MQSLLHCCSVLYQCTTDIRRSLASLRMKSLELNKYKVAKKHIKSIKEGEKHLAQPLAISYKKYGCRVTGTGPATLELQLTL